MADNDYKGIVIRLTEEATRHVRSSKRIMKIINKYAKQESEYNRNEAYDAYSDEDVFKHFDYVLNQMSKELYPFILEDIFQSGKMKIGNILLIDWFEILVKLVLEEKGVEDTLNLLRDLFDTLTDDYDASDYE